MKPSIQQSDIILGSFAPLNSYYKVGPRSNYYIHEGYQIRTSPSYFDDTMLEDQWQLEVYKFAREIFDRDSLATVTDVGCGSGFKLIKFFWDVKTVGIDVQNTLAFLRNKWPERRWIDGALPFTEQSDLVILSDVIEHVYQPDELLKSVQGMNPKQIVISTPDRNLLRVGTFNGPPQNPTHIREWSFIEFRAYIDQWFKVTEHFISNPAQATQCILCEPYAKN
jgi:SAM-dependent methyltransferase